MKKRLLAALLCALMALGLTACGGSADTEPAEGTDAAATETTDADGGNRTVVVAMGSGFSTLDPGRVYEKYPPMIVNACYENLFKFNSNDGEAEPSLAESYEFSEDGMTLTVKLREATFASGNPVTSADVMFSINRCKNLQDNPSFICDTIESMEAPDDLTVVFHLTQPDSATLSKLTYSSLAVLDSEVVKEHGGTDAEDAVTADTASDYLNTTSAGSGMYVMTSYIPDSEIVLEANPNYWRQATNVDKYIIKIQPDSNTQMMGLSTGDIDVAMNMTDDTMAELQSAENVELINAPTKTVGFVMMNMDESIGGPVANPDVQQAIRLALDYAGIQTIVGEGCVTPYSVIQDGFMGSKGVRDTGYQDVEAAKQLLADAGYADRIDLENDILKIAVIERHKNTHHIGIGYIKGYGLKSGAVATSISHDSHNIIVVGTNEEDIAAAANRVVELGGGIVVLDHGEVLGEVRLQIAGIMSEEPLVDVNRELENAKEKAFALGVSRGVDPFMTLSFMALPVIPTLRLTTRGVFDTVTQKYV